MTARLAMFIAAAMAGLAGALAAPLVRPVRTWATR